MEPVDYNEISKIYDDVREGDVQLIDQFLKELPWHCALNILDIGCGTGNYTDLFQKITREYGHTFYGIDPSEAMLNKARQKNGSITFAIGTAGQIPLPANSIDFAYMLDVVHHVPDIHRMFAEIQRVLKWGGKVCVVTQSHKQIEQRPVAQFFPGTIQVDKDRYPAISAILEAAERNSLRYLKRTILFRGKKVQLGADFLELIQKKGYSMLRLLPPEEYENGLRALEGALRNGPIKARSTGETLIWFSKVQP